MQIALILIALFVASFLLGSIPWGVIVSKVAFKKDLRDEGSGNIGATNAVRALGIGGGAAVFLLDAVKGAAAGAIAYYLVAPILVNDFTTDTILLFSAIRGSVTTANSIIHAGAVEMLATSVAMLGCVLGHVFSPWLKFHGGKGISVAFGCTFFALTPLGAAIELGIFLVFVIATRYVSLGSIMAAVACPFIAVWMCWSCWPAVVLVSLAAIVVVWAHRSNIQRLLKGEESKIGSSGEAGHLEDQIESLKPRSERRREERAARKAGRK